MNQYQHASTNVAIAEPSYERSDVRRRDIVNHAISVQETSNTVAALEYLKSHDIAPNVIERVLLEPAKRRHYIAQRSRNTLVVGCTSISKSYQIEGISGIPGGPVMHKKFSKEFLKFFFRFSPLTF